MDKILSQEAMLMEPDAKEYLLLISNCSIRCCINNLEKIKIYNADKHSVITIELCKTLCTNISFQKFEEYVTFLRNKELHKAIHLLYEINDFGYSVIDILDYFFSFIKMTDLFNEDEKYKTTHILCKYITIFHNVHEDIIELALFTNNLLDIIY
jgi:DNA polymerase III gamma/tau subunit